LGVHYNLNMNQFTIGQNELILLWLKVTKSKSWEMINMTRMDLTEAQ
jgi:hypothetical protein